MTQRHGEGRVKVWRASDGSYVWACSAHTCYSEWYDKCGSSAFWELAQHEGDSHARLYHHLPISHDWESTPPGGVHRVS